MRRRGQVEADKRCRIAVGIGNVAELDAGNTAQRFSDVGLVLALPGDDRVELAQLGEPQGPLELVHAEVESQDEPSLHGPRHVGVVVVAVVMVPVGTVIELFAVRDHHAALTGRHGLVVIEAQDPHIAEGPQLFPAEAPAGALGIVLEDLQVVLLRDLHDLVDPRGRAAHVNGDDGLRAGREPFFDAVGVQVEALVDIADNGNGPRLQDGLVGGDEGEGRHDHLVPGAHVQGREGHLQRRRARCDAQGVFHPQVAAEGLLELANLEDALSLLVVTVSHQDACLQDVHQFLDFLFSDQF